MATLADIYNLFASSSELRNRIVAAIMDQAQQVFTESALTSNHVARLEWAKAAMKDWQSRTNEMMWAVIATNSISNNGDLSTDAQIKTAVAALVDVFAV